MGKPALAKRAAFRRHAVSRKRKRKEKETAFHELVTYFKSPTGERFLILEIFIIAALTLLIYMLYQKELEKRQEFQMAVDMIRTVLVGIDPVYIDKEDLEILAAAQNISEELRYFANKNDELQKEIDILTENLNDGWLIYERTLYWFSSEVASWMDAQKNCEREGANLISAESVEEQLFVSTEVQNLKKVFWIGVFKDKGGTWKWLSGKIVSETYWNYYEPNREPNHDCIAMSFDCYYNKCWMAVKCDLPINYVCKKVPKDTWL
ncbi:C-type lectin domain family 17, member A-like isoform X2 [Podarcis raffonei]|uniref:C-type lectin domain family 17, member A-like isoform X2 n=1 Tax=Podarcis raffonei TaxID=65483 RepID=UPI00232937AA|nr:C-type lectin domain family 17, member A-like isoform X2 [Podarcis raffonei]